MKKVIALTLSVMLLSGCAAKQPASTEKPADSKPAATQPAEQKATKTGLGHVVSVAKSVDAAADKNGQAQVNNVMAAVTLDADGKILAVSIDNGQVKVEFDAQGKIKTDLKAVPQTKVELKDKYGMVKASSIKKEWYEQIAELEKWMVGKTVDEVKSLKVKQRDEQHKAVPDIEDLKTKVTISVEDYLAAVEEAAKNAKQTAKPAVKTGLGHVISVAKSVDAAADKNGQAQVNTVMAAASFDADGKIVAVSIDNAQVKVDFDAQGKIKTDLKAAPQTKVELKDKYGMVKASSIKKEWFEQIAELEKWMVGKTVDEVKSLKVKQRDEQHKAVPDIEDLKTKVTISVEDYLAAVEEAYKNAK